MHWRIAEVLSTHCSISRAHCAQLSSCFARQLEGQSPLFKMRIGCIDCALCINVAFRIRRSSYFFFRRGSLLVSTELSLRAEKPPCLPFAISHFDDMHQETHFRRFLITENAAVRTTTCLILLIFEARRRCPKTL